MVNKFEVGKVYFTDDARYVGKGANQKIGWVRIYWLCVKRNDATGYVSFKRFFKDNSLSDSQDSRKVEYEWDHGKPVAEIIRIGYGGDGMWRNWYRLDARKKRD